MINHQNKGNIYIEYGIIFFLVVGFCVLALQAVGSSIKEKFLKDYFGGKKIKISLSGIYAELEGKYGGTKTNPLCYIHKNGQTAIDLGYLTIDNLPANPPSLSFEGNKYGANTLRYYAIVLEELQKAVSKNQNLSKDAIYLKGMIEATYGIANMIDTIVYFNGTKLNYTMPKESVDLVPITIEPVGEHNYLIVNYETYPEEEIVNLRLSKEDYDLVNSVGMIYTNTERLDSGQPLSVWIIYQDLKGGGTKEFYTLATTSRRYTSVDNYIMNYFDKLRFNTNEQFVGVDDFRYYNLVKIYNVYTQLYLSLSQDEVSKYLVTLISKETKNVAFGLESTSLTSSRTLEMSFRPSKPVITNIVKEYTKSVKNISYKKYSDTE